MRKWSIKYDRYTISMDSNMDSSILVHSRLYVYFKEFKLERMLYEDNKNYISEK